MTARWQPLRTARARPGTGTLDVAPAGREHTPTAEEALAEAGARLADGCATVADVAAKLHAARCTGRPGDPLLCPLAQWYTAALRERRMLRRRQRVYVDGATWGRPYLYLYLRQRSGRDAAGFRPVPVPALLAGFASRFDSGGFPELSA